MTPLSDLVDDALVAELTQRIARGDFPGLDVATAMKFLLTDGVTPADDLPVDSLLRLEDWVRAREPRVHVTATQLKNETGMVIDHLLRGRTVILHRHGRPIAELRPYGLAK